MNTTRRNYNFCLRLLRLLIAMQPVVFTASAQALSDRYNKQRPVVVVCDWDKAPYEFLNDRGQPDGSNIDLLKAITHELGIPCVFVMKEWTTALKTFERGEADIILADVRRAREQGYRYTENTINYNRICVATVGSTHGAISKEKLIAQGVVMKYGDYISSFFCDSTGTLPPQAEFQSPKVALQGLLDGDYTYFAWGEESLKWKIKELGMKDIILNDGILPVSEIHIIGRDRDLIYQIDDCYSRLKQRGEVQHINDHWLHPEREKEESSPILFYLLAGIALLGAFIYSFMRLARHHVKSATRHSSELNAIMLKAMHMGNIHVLEYDIRHDRMHNRYGNPILPDEGITLDEFAAHIHPQEQNEFRQKMELLTSGRERRFELNKRWRTFSDSEQWLSLEGHAIVELDADGRPAYIINALSDITQNVKEDQTARELVQKYHVLANMPFMAMSFYDRDGWLIDLNDTMRELCNISPDNPETQRYWQSVSMFDLPLFRSAYAHGACHQLLACLHMDYPDMGINRYVEYDVRPLFNAQGEVANYYCSTLDITDTYDHHNRMRATEHQLQQTLATINRYEQWLNFLTKQGNTYLWYSDIEQRTGYFFRSLRSSAPGDFITMPFDTHLAHMPVPERPTAEAQLCCRDNRPFDAIHHFNSTVTGAQESWFHITGQPILDTQQRVTGHRGQSIDITPEMSTLRRLEAETAVAKDIVRLKSGFMASMTHELRTPLNAIIGFTDVLGAIDSSDERSEYIRIIRNNCDMLQRLINDILTASSLSEGPTNVEAAEVDFSKEFDDICLTLQQRVPHDVRFIKDNPYTSFVTSIDIARANQIITNFVTNAVKFTQQGHIRLSYRYCSRPADASSSTHSTQPEGLLISCEDTGTGIPKDKQSVIFDRFVKLNEFVQGTGMGLSICKTVAERLGGHIGINSEGTGHGSTFWVWIPCKHLSGTDNQGN